MNTKKLKHGKWYDRMIENMQLQSLAPKTQQSYVYARPVVLLSSMINHRLAFQKKNFANVFYIGPTWISGLDRLAVLHCLVSNDSISIPLTENEPRQRSSNPKPENAFHRDQCE